ncbi:MAG: ABC transporter, antibiotic transport system permease protein [Armatimonadetes bacterium CSP1-3]|nr:MAG: ABC transporter, antibiotic transport system permease protein [Armatimonadetes bacterium CSP1-3]
MSWRSEMGRVYAFAKRNLLMAARNVFFVFELAFWPTVGVLSIGLMTRFLDLGPEMTAFLLVGTMALSTVQVCQLDVSYALLFDVWSKSVKHQFLAPVEIRHMALGSWLVGIGRGLTVFGLQALLSWWAFDFDFFEPGVLALGAFLLGCFLTSAVVGLLVCALVLLFGTRAEVSAWATVNLVMVFCGIYYPVSILPEPVSTLAGAFPLTYVLDAFRSHYGFAPEFSHPLLMGFILSALYIGLAHWALAAAVTRCRRTGLLLKLSE